MLTKKEILKNVKLKNQFKVRDFERFTKNMYKVTCKYDVFLKSLASRFLDPKNQLYDFKSDILEVLLSETYFYDRLQLLNNTKIKSKIKELRYYINEFTKQILASNIQFYLEKEEAIKLSSSYCSTLQKKFYQMNYRKINTIMNSILLDLLKSNL